MKAVTCTSLGSIDELQVLDVPSPMPSSDEVRVAVKAASLNFMDVFGDEFAGVVSELGADVRGVALGSRGGAGVGSVCGGSCRARIKARAIPDTMSFRDASAFYVVYGTSLRALKTCAQLKAGELVLGGAGGVGLAAIELGKAMGARVIAAASTAEKRAACIHAGATTATEYEHLRQQGPGLHVNSETVAVF